MITMTVTLRANDSINLSTGVVTRSSASHADPGYDYRARILADSRKRVRRNDMNALAYVMRHTSTSGK